MVVIEGAGSPAEINLRRATSSTCASRATPSAPVLLVGDIDRGGVFAASLGTLELLPPEDRGAVARLRDQQVPGRRLAARDRRSRSWPSAPACRCSASCRTSAVSASPTRTRSPSTTAAGGRRAGAALDVAVVRLPRIANFDDFAPLAAEPGVGLRYVDGARRAGGPDW